MAIDEFYSPGAPVGEPFTPGSPTSIHGEAVGQKIKLRTQAYLTRQNTPAASAYFDYYFSGSDVKVYIEGAANSSLSVAGLGFSIQQNKMPVFGFWSYVYDAVLTGNRIVQGNLVLNFREENPLVTEISRALKNNNKNNFLEGLTTKDKQLRERFWGVSRLDRSLDGMLASDKRSLTKHLFVSHPPFNLVVALGIQNQSLKTNPRQIEMWNKFAASTDYLSKDTNERLVEPGREGKSRFALTGVQIVSMQTAYSFDEPVTEVYQFFARDISPVVR